MTSRDARILGIVVAYYPDAECLVALLNALAHQVNSVLLVDNTPAVASGHDELLRTLSNRFNDLHIHRMEANTGIGKALNYGIGRALKDGYDFVYLSDQDSEPGVDMIRGLLECHRRISEDGANVGCVCPAYHDATTDQLFNFQAHVAGKFFYQSVPAERASPCLEIVTTISSGSLISRRALETVGSMREDLFIDYVDTEWCHRARHNGFRIFGTSDVLLHHRLGDDAFRIWVFGWRLHNLYSPVRIYYRFRNYILVSRLPHVPLRWSLRASWYWLGNLYAYAVFAPRRMRNIKAISLGLLDGFLGISGRCRHDL